MISDIQDTIVALSSAPGHGGRAIVRLSGPHAFQISFTFFRPTDHTGTVRPRYPGFLRLPEFQPSIPASLLAWPGQKTYTGQNLVEIHLLACPPLVDLLVANLLNAGARAAQPGEFTM